MSYETPRSLPSLAHPLIVSPAQGVAHDEEGSFRLPFPEIDLNWDGFTFSHLHWLGIKGTNPEAWKEDIAIKHEFYHQELSFMFFLLRKKYEMFRLYKLIITLFEEEQEEIPVPLSNDLSRNEIEKQLGIIVRLHRASMYIEETYAVRYSLLRIREWGKIRNSRRQNLIKRYKKEYGKFLRYFAVAYDAFDFIAGKIGEEAACHIIYNALGTLNPGVAFFDIIFKICKIAPGVTLNDFMGLPSDEHFVWNLSDKEANLLSNGSFGQKYDFFRNVLDERDPDDSRYSRTRLGDYSTMIEQEWSIDAQSIQKDTVKFLSGSPDTFLLSAYTPVGYYGQRFWKPELIDGTIRHTIQEVDCGNFVIVLEAIRQQLTKGMGLLCPFWGDAPDTCCSSRNKAFLEQVWRHTKPDCSKCRMWERLGCLNQKKL